MEINVDVQGLAEIERRLKLLPQRLGNNAMRRALRKGAGVIRDAARNNAKRFDDPNTPNPIWKEITTASGGKRRERAAGGPMVRVGVSGGARSGKKITHRNNKTNRKLGIVGQEYSVAHWRFLEFGTSNMRAQPFLRPAAAEKAQAAYDAVAAAAPAEIDKELMKLGAT